MKKRGRNESCFCGSGLKYKNCCLTAVEEAVLKLNKGVEVDEETQDTDDAEDVPDMLRG